MEPPPPPLYRRGGVQYIGRFTIMSTEGVGSCTGREGTVEPPVQRGVVIGTGEGQYDGSKMGGGGGPYGEPILWSPRPLPYREGAVTMLSRDLYRQGGRCMEHPSLYVCRGSPYGTPCTAPPPQTDMQCLRFACDGSLQCCHCALLPSTDYYQRNCRGVIFQDMLISSVQPVWILANLSLF